MSLSTYVNRFRRLNVNVAYDRDKGKNCTYHL